MTIHCKLGDKNSIVSYKFDRQSKKVNKIKNAPIEVITTTPPSNLAVPTYEVITEVQRTWIRNAAPRETIDVITYKFRHYTRAVPSSIFFTPTTFRVVSNGRGYLGTENVFLTVNNQTILGGDSGGGNDGSPNVISSRTIFSSVPTSVGIRCESRTDSAQIISVERIDGICSIEVLFNGQRLLKDRGECPIIYDVACDGDCPPDTVKCYSDNYPGYCCLPCEPTRQSIIDIKNIVKSINKEPISYG